MPPLDRWSEEQTALKKAASLRAASKERKLRRYEEGLLADRVYPARHHGWIDPKPPCGDVAFLTVANDKFFRGLEALILSIVELYPRMESPFFVMHDGSLIGYLQRRLSHIYPFLVFEDSKPKWWHEDHGNSANQRRIGTLGYLNTKALGLRGYRRVIILDCDLLVTGGIDPLWAEGDAIRAVPDCGDTAYAVISRKTGRPVINSGVLSIPGHLLNDKNQQEMEALVRERANPYCPLLDSFADQKVWNQYLCSKELELLPVNFNCNIKYLLKYLDGREEGLSVIHFAGEKPWLQDPWIPRGDLSNEAKRNSNRVDHNRWSDKYRQYLYVYYNRQLAMQEKEVFHHISDELIIINPTDNDRLTKASRLEGKSVHVILTEETSLEGEVTQDSLQIAEWLSMSLKEMSRLSDVTVWINWDWKNMLRYSIQIENLAIRYFIIDEQLSADFDQGFDLIDDSQQGLTPYGKTKESEWLAIALYIIRKLTKTKR